tara:strand:- start:365 stop:553 length:189 start_codon:yes stop_codon:yes gene_type:complete
MRKYTNKLQLILENFLKSNFKNKIKIILEALGLRFDLQKKLTNYVAIENKHSLFTDLILLRE